MTTTAKTEASTYDVKGGRTGKMLHRGTERGAGTACGKWLRFEGRHFHVSDPTGWTLCARCFPSL